MMIVFWDLLTIFISLAFSMSICIYSPDSSNDIEPDELDITVNWTEVPICPLILIIAFPLLMELCMIAIPLYATNLPSVFGSNVKVCLCIPSVPSGRSSPRSFHEEYLCYNCYFNFSPFIESSSIVTNRPNIYVWICIKIVRNKILRSKKARVCHK